MANVINTNLPALSAQRHQNTAQLGLQSAMEKLSSGKRINSAKDDAAGLAIAMRMLERINGSNQAMRNANDGVSLAQVAEGGLDEVSGNLQRMRELAVQSANGTLSDADRASLNEEFSALQDEVSRAAGSTEFNGVKVLSQANTLTFQVGDSGDPAADKIDVTTTDITATGGAGIGSALAGNIAIDTATGADEAMSVLDTMMGRVSSLRGEFGSVQNRFDSTITNLATQVENTEAAKSRIMDADYARQTADLTRSSILQRAGFAMQAQANSSPQFVLSLLGG